ncbi:MAG: DUF1616 domain-containing protein [Candidatus Bathyarchaeum sp.]|nr:MAG: DUF1616 domain-containing protein [Candidatus Bathyarchaeum sp.]
MEKKVKRPQKGAKSVSDLDEEKMVTVTILIAIVIIAGLLIYLTLDPAPKESFTTIYYLDSEKRTENFPETVVLGVNNTFSLWVGVENHNGTTKAFSVEIKMDDGKGDVEPSPVEPIERFERTLLDEEVWEFQVTINIDQLGSHRIIFELLSFDDAKNNFEFSGNWVSLSLEAI